MQLTDKFVALLAEAKEESERIEAERIRLINEREEKVRQVREDYGTKLDALSESLKMVTRMERALDPESGKKAKATTPVSTHSPVSEDSMLRLGLALAKLGKAVTTTQVREEAGLSGSVARTGIHQMRDEGLVRPAGMQSRQDMGDRRGGRPSQLWKLTTDGEAWVTEHAQPRTQLTAVA
jgi:ribosomal protein S25